jgi:alpha-glucosidase
MDEAFPLYAQWGVKGVKIDYMDRDDQEMVNFYHRAVKRAAEYRLLVNFHGAFKPDGWQRTWPNLITREGVMGLEYSKWSDKVTPEHDCILPFTRMLAGPMDYTLGGFTNATQKYFRRRMTEPMTQGTRCHQLALYVIFENPLQMLSDYPMNYRNRPGIEFLRHVPVTWDDTKVLHAAVGEYATIARRHGKEWYLGSITNWTARDLSIPLAFLEKGTWTAEIYADGADAGRNAESVEIKTIEVQPSDTLSWRLAPGGGYAVRLVRK